MIITKKLFDDLSYEAVKSSILRVNYDLRNSDCVQSRRMLNALEPGTQLPIHRHLKTSKICLILRGAAEEIFYDDSGKEKERFLLKSNSDCVGIQIPAGVWHRIEVLESGTVIFEANDGTYEPISTENIIYENIGNRC